MRLLKSREAAAAVDVKTWPTIIDTGDSFSVPHLLDQRVSKPCKGSFGDSGGHCQLRCYMVTVWGGGEAFEY